MFRLLACWGIISLAGSKTKFPVLSKSFYVLYVIFFTENVKLNHMQDLQQWKEVTPIISLVGVLVKLTKPVY